MRSICLNFNWLCEWQFSITAFCYIGKSGHSLCHWIIDVYTGYALICSSNQFNRTQSRRHNKSFLITGNLNQFWSSRIFENSLFGGVLCILHRNMNAILKWGSWHDKNFIKYSLWVSCLHLCPIPMCKRWKLSGERQRQLLKVVHSIRNVAHRIPF